MRTVLARGARPPTWEVLARRQSSALAGMSPEGLVERMLQSGAPSPNLALALPTPTLFDGLVCCNQMCAVATCCVETCVREATTVCTLPVTLRCNLLPTL